MTNISSVRMTQRNLQGQWAGHTEGHCLLTWHRLVLQHAWLGTGVSHVWPGSHSPAVLVSMAIVDGPNIVFKRHSNAWLWCCGASLSCLDWEKCQQPIPMPWTGHAHRREPDCALYLEASQQDSESGPNRSRVSLQWLSCQVATRDIEDLLHVGKGPGV